MIKVSTKVSIIGVTGYDGMTGVVKAITHEMNDPFDYNIYFDGVEKGDLTNEWFSLDELQEICAYCGTIMTRNDHTSCPKCGANH